MKILTKIKSLIRQSIITLITDDSEKYPLMQVNYNGKTAYAIRVSPYGLCSNPGSDMFSLVFNSSGNESQKFGIPMDLLNRIKDLKEGEVALHNSKTNNYIYLKNDKDTTIDSKKDTTINSEEDTTINSGEDTAINSTKDTIINSEEDTLISSIGKVVLTGDTVELNGGVNSIIDYTNMKVAFDSLKQTVNTLVLAYNFHTSHPPGNASAVTADMTSAEVPTVKVP